MDGLTEECMSRTLDLVLKHKWFDMIACGEKKEEYREIKPFWKNRFTKFSYSEVISISFFFLFFRFWFGARSARSLSLSLCGGVYLVTPGVRFFGSESLVRCRPGARSGHRRPLGSAIVHLFWSLRGVSFGSARAPHGLPLRSGEWGARAPALWIICVVVLGACAPAPVTYHCSLIFGLRRFCYRVSGLGGSTELACRVLRLVSLLRNGSGKALA